MENLLNKDLKEIYDNLNIINQKLDGIEYSQDNAYLLSKPDKEVSGPLAWDYWHPQGGLDDIDL